MIKKVFIDSDIILDVAVARQPFVEAGKRILSIIELGNTVGMLSSNSITNIYYILRKLSSSEKSKDFIRTIIQYVSVISITHNNIRQALESDFRDFEDAVQYYCAVTHQCDYIVTKNIEDYRASKIPVLGLKDFLALFMK